MEILISNVKSIEHPRNLSIAKAKLAARVILAFLSFRIAPIWVIGVVVIVVVLAYKHRTKRD
jgi:hypothetical protein